MGKDAALTEHRRRMKKYILLEGRNGPTGVAEMIDACVEYNGSQEKLAEGMGVSRVTLNRWRNGHQGISKSGEILLRLATLATINDGVTTEVEATDIMSLVME